MHVTLLNEVSASVVWLPRCLGGTCLSFRRGNARALCTVVSGRRRGEELLSCGGLWAHWGILALQEIMFSHQLWFFPLQCVHVQGSGCM